MTSTPHPSFIRRVGLTTASLVIVTCLLFGAVIVSPIPNETKGQIFQVALYPLFPVAVTIIGSAVAMDAGGFTWVDALDVTMFLLTAVLATAAIYAGVAMALAWAWQRWRARRRK